jgi:hypothetical protein
VLVEGHSSFRLEVALVPDQDARHILAVFFYLLHPMLNPCEGLTVCQVENQDDAVGSAVEHLGDGLVPNLVGNVPNLQLHPFAVDFGIFYFEVDPDGVHAYFLEVVVCVTREDGGLADA